MTTERPPMPQPTFTGDAARYSVYHWPRAKDPDQQWIYDELERLGWRYDVDLVEWWTPLGQPEQRARLCYTPDYSHAWMRPPNVEVYGRSMIPDPILDLYRVPSRDEAAFMLAGLFGDHDFTLAIGDDFTCTEADQLGRALRALCGDQIADWFLFAHSVADEPDDAHFGFLDPTEAP